MTGSGASWRLGAAGGTLLLAAWLASGVYTVPPTSVAVLRRFGAVVETPVPPGVHWWWPWPLGRVDRVEVTRAFSLPLGALPDRPDVSDPVESRWLTGDTNILHLRARVSWRVGDPARFLLGGERPERVLRDAAGAAVTAATSATAVDEVLTTGRLALRETVRRRIQAACDAWGVGIEVLSVDVQAVEPPPSVVQAFQEVQDARADRERVVSEAEAWAGTAVPLARGEAEQRINAARAFEAARVNGARGDADRFARLAAEHAAEPALLERRLYLETAERVLPRVRRYVLEPGGDASMPIRILE